MTVTIRDARLDATGLALDAAACAAVYAPYVTGTATTFEDEPPSDDEMARRITTYAARHAWLLATDTTGPTGPTGPTVLGYAYGSPYRPRPAYRWATEVSVYLAPDAPRRAGIGRALSVALLDRLSRRGYRRAIAGITLPNDASVGLHRSLGFTDVGVERRIGWKHGAWHDALRLQLDLTDPAEPEPPEGPDPGAAPAEPR